MIEKPQKAILSLENDEKIKKFGFCIPDEIRDLIVLSNKELLAVLDLEEISEKTDAETNTGYVYLTKQIELDENSDTEKYYERIRDQINHIFHVIIIILKDHNLEKPANALINSFWRIIFDLLDNMEIDIENYYPYGDHKKDHIAISKKQNSNYVVRIKSKSILRLKEFSDKFFQDIK